MNRLLILVPFSLPPLLIHTKPFGSVSEMDEPEEKPRSWELVPAFPFQKPEHMYQTPSCEEHRAWHQIWKKSERSEFPGSEDRSNYCAEKRGVSGGLSPSPPGSVTMDSSSHCFGLSFFICIQIYGVTEHPQIWGSCTTHPKPPGCLWTLALENLH